MSIRRLFHMGRQPSIYGAILMTSALQLNVFMCSCSLNSREWPFVSVLLEYLAMQ